MTAYVEDRIINGLLKACGADHTPESIKAVLHIDVEIIVDERRACADDLWPAVWSLASVLERQVTGRIFIRGFTNSSLPCPVPLGPRCAFVSSMQNARISIGLGIAPSADAEIQIIADARCKELTIGGQLDPSLPSPSAVECFLLAGYIGYRVLALCVGISLYRDAFASAYLRIDCDIDRLTNILRGEEGFTFVGLGQLGQGYLALLYFLFNGDFGRRLLNLIDKDKFIDANGRTQILLREGDRWLNEYKAEFVESVVAGWNSLPASEKEFIDFEWRRESRPGVAFIGLHDLEGRRMACNAGFTSIVESGVGTDLLQPRVSWHVLQGDIRSRKYLFKEAPVTTEELGDFAWTTELKNTQAGCGWVRFNSVTATAPSLGLIAVASSLASYGFSQHSTVGRACVWSQLLTHFIIQID